MKKIKEQEPMRIKMYKSIGHKAKVVFNNGFTVVGYPSGYQSSYDSDDGEAWVDMDVGEGLCCCFSESDIKSIEILD